ncbi:MAG TPA: ATP-binding protein [Polyangiaceae bacterium]|nr:ATP-binding protein [Polyangiaceae bacterium]
MPRFAIRERLDVFEPRRLVRSAAAAVGFRHNCCLELAIVVSELCSNVLKYGIEGSIEFDKVVDPPNGPGLVILATDIGPPFRNLELALQDGHDDRGPIDPGSMLTRGGLGTGLGAITRLTDAFSVQYAEGSKTISVKRYVTRPRTTAVTRK